LPSCATSSTPCAVHLLAIRLPRYDLRGRESIKPPRLPLSTQLNLPLLDMAACVVPGDKQAELVLALVELLIGAAVEPAEGPNDGGDDESEADR
jgi:hypothetical protein